MTHQTCKQHRKITFGLDWEATAPRLQVGHHPIPSDPYRKVTLSAEPNDDIWIWGRGYFVGVFLCTVMDGAVTLTPGIDHPVKWAHFFPIQRNWAELNGVTLGRWSVTTIKTDGSIATHVGDWMKHRSCDGWGVSRGTTSSIGPLTSPWGSDTDNEAFTSIDNRLR